VDDNIFEQVSNNVATLPGIIQLLDSEAAIAGEGRVVTRPRCGP
jgi:hypothetical protein